MKNYKVVIKNKDKKNIYNIEAESDSEALEVAIDLFTSDEDNCDILLEVEVE